MSFLERVKNKISHGVESSLTDPDSDKWASEKKDKEVKEAKEAAEKAQKEAEEKKSEDEKKKKDLETQKLQQRKNFGAKDSLKTAWTTFLKVFGTLLIIALILHAGSLCANDAIARSTLYRVLYFIYAAIPIFSIPVLIYYHIYRRYKGTMPQVYTMLPIREQPEIQSTIISYLLAPFTYVPDLQDIGKKQEALRIMWEDAVKMYVHPT